MGISLPRAEDELADDEPFLPDVPSRSALADRLLPVLLAGRQITTTPPFVASPRPAPNCPMARWARWCWSASSKR